MTQLSDISVQYLKGVGPARKKTLENLGVATIEDLLYLFPRRYEDRSKLTKLKDLKIGEYQTVAGKVLIQGGRQSWFTRKHVYETVIDDGSGRMFAVWFNQPYLDKYFRPGTEVVLYGQVAKYKNRIQMISPEYEILDKEDQSLSMGRIVPIYPLTKGITQRYLRKIMKVCIDRYGQELQDTLPVSLRNKHRLMNIQQGIGNIHFPENVTMQEEAHRRISFEEFFFFQISVIKRRMSIVQRPGIKHNIAEDLIPRYWKLFPFELTLAQKRVIGDISIDMKKSSPMLRLLQGDVGSGKTLVAFFGCVAAFEHASQSAIMAPTEILARQHFANMTQNIAVGPFKNLQVRLLVNSLSAAEKNEILEGLAKGTVHCVIGTHALISEQVVFKHLSYVVVDEQHKFGVRQRALLSSKGVNPDILVMTATPIPRTLCYTLFGDLDVSILNEMPPGRGKVTTQVFSHVQAQDVYKRVREDVLKGRQAYIIYPLVDESEVVDLKAAETSFKHFEKSEFKDFKLGLVHGQMKRDQAETVMRKFKNHEIQILVATSVLEVGIDVANATVMVIEHAERFGLSQLHQLRGRIGRGAQNGSCLLISDPVTIEAHSRLQAITSTTDGFKIAEQDLLIRGPGQYFGRHQHGLNELRFANPVKEIDLLQLARAEAEEITHQDPDLASPLNQPLKAVIEKRYPGYLEMVTAG